MSVPGIIIKGPALIVTPTERGFLIERADGEPMDGEHRRAYAELLFRNAYANAPAIRYGGSGQRDLPNSPGESAHGPA